MSLMIGCLIFGILAFSSTVALILGCLISFARENSRLGKEPFDFTGDPPPLDDNEYGEISDGFGNTWSSICPECNKPSVFVVRPGKTSCWNCEEKEHENTQQAGT